MASHEPTKAIPPRILILMADQGQDPTECSIPWKVFKQASFCVEFATENGTVAGADSKLLQPSLFRTVLGPKKEWVDCYREMEASEEFQHPKKWSEAGFSLAEYDAILLPGGHDKPIRQYLESKSLHRLVADYLPMTVRGGGLNDRSEKVVGAICHGVLVLAFATTADSQSGDPASKTSTSLLSDVETTTLPQWMELTAQSVASLWGLGKYYRTYPSQWTDGEVTRLMNDHKTQYKRGPLGFNASFTHADPKRHYISGRWPGDAQELAEKIVEEVKACRAQHIGKRGH